MTKMKVSLSILLVAVSLHTVSAEATEVASISTVEDFTSVGYPNPSSLTVSASNINGGYLEEAEIAIGIILKSRHFSKYDYLDYNDTHDGVYINVDKWSVGTYKNSADNRSVAITYNPSLYRKESLKINLVVGIANGYEGWEYAQGDYLPILGVSAQWGYLKTVLLPDLVAFGIELPLN